MFDIQKIISAIDDELSRTGKSHLSPPEANLILAQKKLLSDSEARNGLPLRRLLRNGRIPHAFQIGGKGSEWRIPHSTFINKNVSNYNTSDKQLGAINILNKKTVGQAENVNEQIESARLSYKPEKVKYLLITEAPPDNRERFFYYENVKKGDSLFLETMKVLYPDDYINTKITRSQKKEFLEKFCRDGYYLVDASDKPMGKKSESYKKKIIAAELGTLLNKVNAIANENTIIILISKLVYQICYSPLKSGGFNVVNVEMIDFPGSSRQIHFRTKMKNLICNFIK